MRLQCIIGSGRASTRTTTQRVVVRRPHLQCHHNHRERRPCLRRHLHHWNHQEVRQCHQNHRSRWNRLNLHPYRRNRRSRQNRQLLHQYHQNQRFQMNRQVLRLSVHLLARHLHFLRSQQAMNRARVHLSRRHPAARLLCRKHPVRLQVLLHLYQQHQVNLHRSRQHLATYRLPH